MPNYTVRKVKLEKSDQLDKLARAAGELYSQTLVSFWRTVRKKGVWMSGYSMERWHISPLLHAHSSDAITQCFFASLKSWRKRRKTDPNSKPPRRRRWFFKLIWKSAAIKLKDGKIRLSNGKGNKPLVIDWQWEKPKQIELGWNKASQCYEVRACYISKSVKSVESEAVAGCDLGEIHPMAIADGVNTTIFNGRLLRSKRRYQNKLKGKLSKLIDKKKRGSKKRKQLVKTKQKQLAKIKNQIKDIEHKLTSLAVSMLKEKNTQTLVIGDVRDIRHSIDYGRKNNQKLHHIQCNLEDIVSTRESPAFTHGE